MVEIVLELLLLGAVAGTLAGLLGIGGGIVIVPALLWLFNKLQVVPVEHMMHFALGTSLATICFTSISSVRAHHKRGAILWRIVLLLSPGLVVGTLLGTQFAGMLSTRHLAIFFAIFLLTVSIQMGLGLQPKATRQLPGTFGTSLIGLVIGIISSLVGIGGGTLTVPILTWCNVPMRTAVATSSAGGIFIALAGTVGFMMIGPQAMGEGHSGFIYWPAVLGIVPASLLFAPLGAKLAHSLPVATLKQLFSLFLFVVGAKLLLKNYPHMDLKTLIETLNEALAFIQHLGQALIEDLVGSQGHILQRLKDIPAQLGLLHN